MERSTVLVTGAGGFIGRPVCEALQRAGWQVRRQTRKPEPGAIAADLCVPGALEAAAGDLKPEAVVHLAAVFPGVADAESRTEDNLLMIQNLMTWMRGCGTKALVFASSGSVYGAAPPPWREDAEPAPQGWYAEGKLAAEKLLAGGPWRTVSLRISAPYGPNPAVPTVVHRFLTAAAAGTDLTLWGTGARTQHFVHVDDVAEAVRLALESEAAGVYNISGPRPVSMAKLAAACVAATGGRAGVRFSGEDPQESWRGWFPSDRAARDFGYLPRVELPDGLLLTARAAGLCQ